MKKAAKKGRAVKTEWPPKAHKHEAANVSGEPSWVYLRRFDGTGTLHGRIWNTCCGCGMEHLVVFNVLRQKNGEWWLTKRAYDAGEAAGWSNQHKKPARKPGKDWLKEK